MKTLNVVVMDYSICKVTYLQNIILPEENDEDESTMIENYLSDNGFHLSNCNWMSSEDEIEFEI
jgi:hypothetical protein